LDNKAGWELSARAMLDPFNRDEHRRYLAALPPALEVTT
jgi:hypothetical protein